MSEGELVLVSAEERAYRAYNLRVTGKSWDEIALELDYSSGSDAKRKVTLLVNKARGVMDAERRAEIVEMELDRLDKLQSAIWDIAITGSLKDMEMVLKIMTLRAKYVQNVEENRELSSRTVIVTSDRFIEGLREIE